MDGWMDGWICRCLDGWIMSLGNHSVASALILSTHHCHHHTHDHHHDHTHHHYHHHHYHPHHHYHTHHPHTHHTNHHHHHHASHTVRHPRRGDGQHLCIGALLPDQRAPHTARSHERWTWRISMMIR